MRCLQSYISIILFNIMFGRILYAKINMCVHLLFVPKGEGGGGVLVCTMIMIRVQEGMKKRQSKMFVCSVFFCKQDAENTMFKGPFANLGNYLKFG